MELALALGMDLFVAEEGEAQEEYVLDSHRSGLFTFWLVPGPLTMILEEYGWIEVSQALLKDSPTAIKLFSIAMSQVNTRIAHGLDLGVDGVIIADDLAGDSGPFIPPKVLNELYFPSIRPITSLLSKRQIPALFHSDGCFGSLLPSIWQAGFTGIHGLQPTLGGAFNELPAIVGDSGVYWGGFAFEGLREIKNPTEAQRDAALALASWRGRGFIFGSVTGLYEGLPYETVKAVYQGLE